MRIAIYSEDLGCLGGAEVYGLMLAAPLAGLHDLTVYHLAEERDYARLLRERFDLDLGAARFVRCDTMRAARREIQNAELLINITDASIMPNIGVRGILCVFFPLPLADYPPRGFSASHCLERGRQWLLEAITAIVPSIMLPRPRGFRAYAKDQGPLAALLRLPAFAARSCTWRGYRDLRFGRKALQTYDRILACSRFGAEWVQRYYGRPAEVLYPPIAAENFRPGPKLNEIIAVGRFDDGEKSKKFHVLVAMFKTLYDEGPLRGWVLHCCGGLHGPETEAYLERLRSEAAGYPIEFHPDLPFRELMGRYATATMFWHAMGYGENVEEHPWRFEHFGMTTAEAMAAGCVPIVIDAGGQPEIVAEPAMGYRWMTLEEFAAAVRAFLALSEAERAALAAAARSRAEYFDRKAFFERSLAIYQSLGIPTRSLAELISAPTHEGSA